MSMENLLGTIGFIVFGVVLIILAFTKWCKKGARAIVIVVGAIFIILGLACGFEKPFVYALIFAGSFGTLCIIAGIDIVFGPLRNLEKRQGNYIAAVCDNKNRYNIVCQYEYNGKIVKGMSEEQYTGKEVEKRFREGENVDIWVSTKNPETFRIKRFYGFVGGIILILLGLLCFNVPRQVWMALH